MKKRDDMERARGAVQYFMVSVNEIEYRGAVVGARQVLEALLEGGKWQLGESAANRRALKCGDRLVFYVGGKRGQAFVGEATVGSEPVPIADHRPKLPFMKLELELEDAELWPVAVPVRPLLERLSFVEGRLLKYWGLYFRQSVRKLSRADYDMIMEISSHLNTMLGAGGGGGDDADDGQ